MDYGDDYGEDDYGSQEQRYYYGEHNPNAGMLEGSGGSGEYDDEDLSDESGMLRQQLIAQQLAAAKAQQANLRGFNKVG